MSARTVDEWGGIRSDASAALRWIRACARQVLRWQEAHRQAHGGEDVDWDGVERAFTEGYFLVMAADQMRLALAKGVHRDLLRHLPPPSHVKGKPGERSDGARYLRDIRNAHEHHDEDGRFGRTYGYGHAWHVGPAGSLSASVGGIELTPFLDGLMRIEAELTRRHAEAAAEYDRLLQQRLGARQ